MTDVKNPTLENEINAAEQLDLTQVYDLTQVSEGDEHLNAEAVQKHEQAEAEKQEKARKPRRRKPAETQSGDGSVWGLSEGEQKPNETETEFIKPENSGGANPVVDAGVVTLNSLIPAEVLTTIIDKGMSVLLPLALNNLAGTKLKPADFRLSAEEKKTMKPAIERAAATIKINFNNPWVALGFVATAVYGAKAVEKVNFDDIDADDLGAPSERKQRQSSANGQKRKRDYAAEYRRRMEREGRA